MIFVKLLSASISTLIAMALPGPVAAVGGVFLGLAVVGGVAGAVCGKLNQKKKGRPDDFELMVAKEMEAQGVCLDQTVQESPKEEAVVKQQAADAAENETEDGTNEPIVEDREDGQTAQPTSRPDSAQDEVHSGAAVGRELSQDDLVQDVEQEEQPLVRSEQKEIAMDGGEQDIPDLIPTQQSAAVAAMAIAVDSDTSDEEVEVLQAAEESTPQDNADDALLDSMTAASHDYGDFDFGGDFDDWQEEEDAEDEGEVLASLEADDDETTDEKVDEAILGSKYRRSFRSKLIQGSKENKEFYSLIKNRLLSYDKMRVKENWGGETYMYGRRTYVRLGMGGKTLCVFYALDPAAFDVKKVHHRDVSGVRKYVQTPMMMRVKSDLSCRRALRLIEILADDNHIPKKSAYGMADYTQDLAYKDDDALIALNLIKLNPRYVQKIDSAEAIEAKEDAMRNQFRDVTPLRKDQVTNLLATGEAKEGRKEREQRASGEGKFVINTDSGTFRFMYYTASGKLLCVSDSYKSYEMAIKAVDAYRTAIQGGEAVIATVDDKFFYTLRTRGRVFNSVMYDSQSACLDGLRQARDYADDAVIEYNPNN